MKEQRPSPFAAFAVVNFRRFVAGQSLSLIGSWTETVAQALLVLQLTGSGLALGLVTAARYLPVLLFSPYAGLIVDRSDKRRLLIVTASSLAGLSLVTGTLVATDLIEIWMLFVIAFSFGCFTALDNPARQAFIPEMVGQDLIHDAVTLNSTFVNVGRAVGPIVAAALVSSIGIASCFFVNAVSFAFVLAALLSLRTRDLQPSHRVAPEKGQLIAGFRYARGLPLVLAPLAMMALIGTFTYEFEVSLPLFARADFGPGFTAPWLIVAFGSGSVIGGLYCALRPRTGRRRILSSASLYAVSLLATAFASTLWIAIALLVVVGMASITFLTTGNSTIQLASSPSYRGRVTALWSTAFLGTTPIGATVIGWVGGIDPRLALVVGAFACALAVAVGAFLTRRPEAARTDEPLQER
ncbi:MFS transporter [Herbiconiux sp. CPCC 205763]|uniref:MFS transporter n=1 Tax=Herbiconiux aconitum TaxID=2970913 RepID=A0ABT2GXN3_9MICO|nr:MFS transporter [Herbiconiux aconitum]MCS5720332.1 MFS transporter [Herbiconiux aconitum]